MRGLQKVERRITAHTAISNYTLRIQPEQFFSTEVLERNQTFRGFLTCREDVAPSLLGKREVLVGRGATRGQGFAEIHIQDARPNTPDFAARLRRDMEPGRLAFTVTLLSPCVLYDKYLCARPYLEAEDISAAGGQSGALKGFDLVRSFCRLVTISGWNSQASLPKSDVVAIAPGSAFLFEKAFAPGEREGELARVAGVLEKAVHGIGERWADGFGEVSFQDKFHWEHRYAG
jgi:hypothetical protein